MTYNFPMAVGLVLVLAQLLVPAILRAQEVRYIDLTGIQQRTDLRRPPAPPCKGGVCTGFASGASILDGAPDFKDPRALTVQILSAAPDPIDPAQPIEVEFRVLNSGGVPLELPV